MPLNKEEKNTDLSVPVSVSRTASAAAAQTCPADGICYSVGVPSASAQSNSGNIYFQIQAKTSYQWVALGQGTGMIGANIFVM